MAVSRRATVSLRAIGCCVHVCVCVSEAVCDRQVVSEYIRTAAWKRAKRPHTIQMFKPTDVSPIEARLISLSGNLYLLRGLLKQRQKGSDVILFNFSLDDEA